jgi:hypothetical protein
VLAPDGVALPVVGAPSLGPAAVPQSDALELREIQVR